ncbi:hypothetical protein GCM10022254_29080 [Actinomadura meridiana]|uniref:Histidine kinase/HSP90-like ATPase domain-containing protein n=1 Tax=Actinomadura meridiana TaxID=559626 RepID=A0ABP8C171_9ACTN
MRTIILPRRTSRSQKARTFEWPLEVQTARAAREAVRKTLTTWGVQEGDIYFAVLLASEVVTNAIQHVRPKLRRGGTMWLRVCLMDGRLRVDVTDPEPGFPVHIAASDTDENHRGMAVVAGCSDRWGWRPGPNGGKTVWWTQILEAPEPLPLTPRFRRIRRRH